MLLQSMPMPFAQSSNYRARGNQKHQLTGAFDNAVQCVSCAIAMKMENLPCATTPPLLTVRPLEPSALFQYVLVLSVLLPPFPYVPAFL